MLLIKRHEVGVRVRVINKACVKELLKGAGNAKPQTSLSYCMKFA